MAVEIEHLFRRSHHLPAVARLIYNEFWADVRGGMTVAQLEAHLRTATNPQRIPLSLLALDGDELLGTVNLIDNDDDQRAHLHPWLAALVVVAPRRGRGVGSQLVAALLAQAAQMQIAAVYFGTDGPGFYARLGAQVHEEVKSGFFIMRFELPATASSNTGFVGD